MGCSRSTPVARPPTAFAAPRGRPTRWPWARPSSSPPTSTRPCWPTCKPPPGSPPRCSRCRASSRRTGSSPWARPRSCGTATSAPPTSSTAATGWHARRRPKGCRPAACPGPRRTSSFSWVRAGKAFGPTTSSSCARRKARRCSSNSATSPWSKATAWSRCGRCSRRADETMKRTKLQMSALMLAAAAQLAFAPRAKGADAPGWRVGVGMSDVTGEAAEVGMMGYAELTQKTSGIHQRLRARAFITEDLRTQRSPVIVVTDTGLVTQAVHQAVMKRLAAKFGDRYTERNVMLTATHTHAGPGGYSHPALYNITILGFQQRTFNAIVDGIVEARAHFPQEIDPLMTVLSFRQAGQDIGALSFFATHGTSMTKHNTLISGDNKGYAAWHWEHDVAGVQHLHDTQPFVAGFAQTNPGDLTPNLNAKPGSGPTEDEFENTRLIGLRQADKAVALSQKASEALGGDIDSRMRYVDMSRVQVSGAYTPDGKPMKTCPAALGSSFAAGSTEDGPGPGIAKEGQPNPFLTAVGGLVFWPSATLRECHGVKEVVIPAGNMKPHPWSQEVLPLQVIKIGSIAFAGLPAEGQK